MIKQHLFVVLAGILGFQPMADAASAVYSSMPAVDCVINPYRVVDIASPVAGIIDDVFVERSEKVSAGQVVAQLDASVERANVALARYRASVQSEIGLGQVNMSFDSLRKQRVDTLLAKQNISKENADQIVRELELSKLKLQQAKELARIRKLELRRAEEQLRQKSIRAPFDGYVLDTFKYRGEHVEEQAILRLAQLDPLVVEAIVPMESFGRIVAGMQAEIRPEVLFDENLTGMVTAVDRIGDTASNTFGVKLTIANPDNRIPAGLKCIVKFIEKTVAQLAEEEALQEAQKTEQGRQSTVGESNEITKPAKPAAVTEKTTALSEIDDVNTGVPLNDSKAGTLLAEVKTKPSSKQRPSSFMVAIKQGETNQATRELIDQLRKAGVSDFQEIDHGIHKGLIALGIYNFRSYAVNRQRALEKLGFAPFINRRS